MCGIYWKEERKVARKEDRKKKPRRESTDKIE
jgi:hypothetical protein